MSEQLTFDKSDLTVIMELFRTEPYFKDLVLNEDFFYNYFHIFSSLEEAIEDLGYESVEDISQNNYVGYLKDGRVVISEYEL